MDKRLNLTYKNIKFSVGQVGVHVVYQTHLEIKIDHLQQYRINPMCVKCLLNIKTDHKRHLLLLEVPMNHTYKIHQWSRILRSESKLICQLGSLISSVLILLKLESRVTDLRFLGRVLKLIEQRFFLVVVVWFSIIWYCPLMCQILYVTYSPISVWMKYSLFTITY